MVIQLAIGIFLLLLLMFVLVLLVTEVVASGPSSKQENLHLHPFEPGKKNVKNTTARNLLLSLCCLTGISLCLYFISRESIFPPDNTLVKTNSSQPEQLVLQKNFADSATGNWWPAALQTKWVDGKIFGKATLLQNSLDTLPAFNRCSLYLLDSDGYLLLKFDIQAADLLVWQTPEGRMRGYRAQVNAPLSLTDYQRITTLKLVLDKKLID